MKRPLLRPMIWLPLVFLLAFTNGPALTQVRSPSSGLADAAILAERLVEDHENDLSKEQTRARRIALATAYERVMRLDPGYYGRDPSHFGPTKVLRLLGMLAIYEGQFAEAERRFEEAVRIAEQSNVDREEIADLMHARATALALDGRFDSAAAQLASAPCPKGASCSVAFYGEICRKVQVKSITVVWSLVKRGPKGLCPASAFLSSAEIAETFSRPDLVEPFARMALFAATDLRFVSARDAGDARFEATLFLSNWLRLHNRDTEAAALVRAGRTDSEMAASGGAVYVELDSWARNISSASAKATAPPPVSLSRPDSLNQDIAVNERTLKQVLPNPEMELPWLGGPRPAVSSIKVASQIHGALAMQYRLKRDFGNATKNSDRAIYLVPGFVAPSLPLRLDMGPRGPECPPWRVHQPECRTWNDDLIDRYASVFVSELLHERALIEADTGNISEALAMDARGGRVLQNWLSRNWIAPQDVLQTLEQRRWLESERLSTLAHIARGSGPEAETAKARAFEAVQLLQFNRVEAGVRSAIARGASGTAEQQLILQERQRLQEERSRVRNDRTASEALAGRIAILESQLPFSASEFERLTSFVPLDLTSARAALMQNEALVVLTQLDDRMEAMVVTTTEMKWVSVPVTDTWVRAEVKKLRHHLDRSRGDQQGFDRNAAYALYQRILAPMSDQLGKRLLFVSANGPLAEIPLQILVTEKPSGSDIAPQALRDTAWLLRDHALVSLPSVASLRSLKAQRRVNRRNALIGVGDPPGAAPLKADEVRNDDDTQLKYAAMELEKLGRSRRGPVSIMVGRDATEARLRLTDLRSTAILAFATHARQGGSIGSPDPGLVLALGQRGITNANDDGFLSAPEVALLPIGADIVILSACSTASSDGRGGEVLSGLALSFLFAGGQSVIATHWPVVDAAAARLVTGAIGAGRSPSPQELAQALQVEMRQLLMDSSVPHFSDPRIWGAFVVVGG